MICRACGRRRRGGAAGTECLDAVVDMRFQVAAVPSEYATALAAVVAIWANAAAPVRRSTRNPSSFALLSCQVRLIAPEAAEAARAEGAVGAVDVDTVWSALLFDESMSLAPPAGPTATVAPIVIAAPPVTRAVTSSRPPLLPVTHR